MLIARSKVTVLPMPDLPTPLLRTRTDDDLDVLFSMAADLDTWEERNPWAPAPLTRKRFDARLAHAAESDAHEDPVTFVVDVEGTAVGAASLFEFPSRSAAADHEPARSASTPDVRATSTGPATSPRPCARRPAGA